MIRSSRRLADGREILYFDAEPTARDAVDPRDLPPVSTLSQMRYDALLGEWVVVASHRQTRTFLPPADDCPLCPPDQGGPATEVPAEGWAIAVFENRFPSFASPAPTVAAPGEPWRAAAADGACEVVVYTPDHDARLAVASPADLRRLV